MREYRCSKPIKKLVNFKISWLFHGSLRTFKNLITKYQIVKNYLRLQSVVFSKINQFKPLKISTLNFVF